MPTRTRPEQRQPQWTSILVRVTNAVKEHHDQSNPGSKGFIQRTLPHHCLPLQEVRAGLKQGSDPEAGADAEATEESCLLACFSSHAQPAFLWNLGHSAQGWDNLWSLVKKKAQEAYPEPSPMEGSSQSRVPPPDDCNLCPVDIKLASTGHVSNVEVEKCHCPTPRQVTNDSGR